MLKYLLSLFSILVLLLPSVFVPTQTAACPIKLPETLLSLYRSSDAIYVARFDKVEDREIIENTDERTVINIRKHFDISSALKGESRKLFVLESQDYRYKPSADSSAAEDAVEEVPEEEEVEFDDLPFGAGTLRSGDLVLLFLKADEGDAAEDGRDGRSLQLTDFRDGIKRMTPERLESYEARIRELNSIFSAKKVDDAAIVEWLVRCTRDPATRWEGAYQFQQSFQQLEWLKRQQEEAKEEAKETEPTEETEAAQASEQGSGDDATLTEVASESDAGEEADNDISAYARLLSDSQKESLMRILIERQTSSDAQAEKLGAGDKVLVDVVSNWGDRRFAKFLLDRLQGFGGEPYEVSELMSTIAKILSDDDLSKTADRYSNVYYENDDDQVESEDLKDESDETDGMTEDGTAATEKAADPAKKAETKEGEIARVTYRQLRDGLLQTFLDRSLLVLAIDTENANVNK